MVIMMVVMLALVEMVAAVVIKIMVMIVVLIERGLRKRNVVVTKAILHSCIDVYRFDDNIRNLLVYLFVKD